MAATNPAADPGVAETRKQVKFELEPELRPIAERALAVLELAAKKAIAHDAAPKEYPMPAGTGHLEQLMYARLKQRPADRRKKSAAQVMPTLRSGAAAVPGLGPKATINLGTAKPVVDQVGPQPKKEFDPDRLLGPAGNGEAALASAPKTVIVPYTGVELRIHKVVCREETNEWGSDEFELSGVSIDATGDTRQLSRFRVSSDFDSGEKVTYSPPKIFATFPFSSDNSILVNGKTKTVGWPRNHYVTFLPAEIDQGGFPDFATELYKKAKDMVTKYVAQAVGAYFGGALGAAIGAVVGKIVGWVMDKLFDLLVRWWEDDIFIPLTSTAKVLGASVDFKGKAGGTAITSPRMLWWKQHGGHYEVHYDWHLYVKK